MRRGVRYLHGLVALTTRPYDAYDVSWGAESAIYAVSWLLPRITQQFRARLLHNPKCGVVRSPTFKHLIRRGVRYFHSFGARSSCRAFGD